MKHVIILWMSMMLSTTLLAQKLYVNDIPNGNYTSYDIGDEIEFALKNDSVSYKGIITAFQKDGFTLNDTFQVHLSSINALLKKGGGTYGVGRVLLMVLGSYMILSGAGYVILGVVAATYITPLGVAIALVGAGLGAGGYAIINHQVKKSKQRTITHKSIDNIQYRLFIE